MHISYKEKCMVQVGCVYFIRCTNFDQVRKSRFASINSSFFKGWTKDGLRTNHKGEYKNMSKKMKTMDGNAAGVLLGLFRRHAMEEPEGTG